MSDKLFHPAITVGDVDDLEKLCRRIVSRVQRRYGAWLPDDEQDDLVSFVVGETYMEVLDQLGPSPNGHTASLSSSVAWFQTIEWYRKRWGRNGQKRPAEEPLSLDLAIDEETAERPLQAAYGQASPFTDLRDHERELLVLNDLTAPEIASLAGMRSAKEVARYRRQLRESAADLRHLV